MLLFGSQKSAEEIDDYDLAPRNLVVPQLENQTSSDSAYSSESDAPCF